MFSRKILATLIKSRGLTRHIHFKPPTFPKPLVYPRFSYFSTNQKPPAPLDQVGEFTKWHNLGTQKSGTNPDEAIEAYKKSLEYEKDLSGDKDHTIASIHLNLGALYIPKQKYDEASKHLEQARDIALNSKQNLDELLVKIYAYLGTLANTKQYYPTAIEYFDKFLALQQKTSFKNDTLKATILRSLAEASMNGGDPNRVRPTIEEALKTYAQIEPKNDVIKLEEVHAYILLIQSCIQENLPKDWDTAMQNINKIIELSKTQKPQVSQWIYENAINLCYLAGSSMDYPNDVSLALAFYTKGKDILDQYLGKITDNSGQVLFAAGTSYLVLEKYDLALQAFKRLEETFDSSMGQKGFPVSLFLKISKCLLETGELQDALWYLDKCQKHWESLTPKMKASLPQNAGSDIQNLYFQIFCVHQLLGNYQKSLSFSQKVIDMVPSTLKDSSYDMLLTLFINSINNVVTGNEKQAVKNLERAIKVWSNSIHGPPNLGSWLIGNLKPFFLKTKDTVAVQKVLKEAIEVVKKSPYQNKILPDILYLSALCNYEQGNYAQCKEDLTSISNGLGKFTSQNPDDNGYSGIVQHFHVITEDECLKTFEKLIENNKGNSQLSEKLEISSLWAKIGFEYFKRRDAARGMDFMKASKQALSGEGNAEVELLRGHIDFILGALGFEVRRYQNALEHWNQSIEAFRTAKKNAHLSLAHFWLAKSYRQLFDQKNYKNYLGEAEKLLGLAKSENIKDDQKIASFVTSAMIGNLKA